MFFRVGRGTISELRYLISVVAAQDIAALCQTSQSQASHHPSLAVQTPVTTGAGCRLRGYATTARVRTRTLSQDDDDDDDDDGTG